MASDSRSRWCACEEPTDAEHDVEGYAVLLQTERADAAMRAGYSVAAERLMIQQHTLERELNDEINEELEDGAGYSPTVEILIDQQRALDRELNDQVEEEEVDITNGDMLLFRGDVEHYGVGYPVKHFRVHAYGHAADFEKGAPSVYTRA